MMDTLDGYWIVKIPGKGRRRSKIFPGEGNTYPEGTKVSVGAYTRKGENIARIPLVIGFRYERKDSEKEENISDIIEFLSKAFKISLVLTTTYEANGFIHVLYIFDDREICSKLRISHNLYLEQIERFYSIVGNFINYIHSIQFIIFKRDNFIQVSRNSKKLSISTTNNYSFINNFFTVLVRNVAQEINCRYIKNFIKSVYGLDLINVLVILKEFNDIRYKMLYKTYINLIQDKSSLYKIINNIINTRYKIAIPQKWNCKKDCPCYCGLNSPLHSIIDEYEGAEKDICNVRENSQIPKFVDIDSIIILFGGCHILKNINFLINDKQIHMGVLEFISPTHKSNKKEIEDIFSSNKEVFSDIKSDIESSDIRTIRKDKIFSSILSFSSDSSFIKLLQRRGEHYPKKLDALIDSQPFISSIYKKGQGKSNILQFIDNEKFHTLFSYEPLHKSGFLERAIVSRDLPVSPQYVAESLHKITKFISQSENIVRINMDVNKFKKKYTYEYNSNTTIFTKKGLENFYITTAMKIAVLFSIIEKGKLDTKESYINISDSIIDKSSLLSLMFIAYRDKLLFRLTKKYRLKKSFKNYLKEYKWTFIYHRDITRKFSSYSKSLLNAVINGLIQDSALTKIITHNANNKKIILYQVNNREL